MYNDVFGFLHAVLNRQLSSAKKLATAWVEAPDTISYFYWHVWACAGRRYPEEGVYEMCDDSTDSH